MNIGENIRRFRNEGGYTQKELARIIGVKESYISALERGQRRPGKKMLPLLCDALGVDGWAILFGTREIPDGGLSPEIMALLTALEGFPKDVIRTLTQLILKLKRPANKLDPLLRPNLPISIRYAEGAYLAPLEYGCGRTRPSTFTLPFQALTKSI
jgi:transcriptional regulator with XRE-family HTH domain